MQNRIFILTGLIIAAGVLLSAGFYFDNDIKFERAVRNEISNFDGCAGAGYPVMESYPRQCRTPDGKSFIEYIGNELEKENLIKVSHPRPNQSISSPLEISGEARGYWFFEASFSVRLFDAGGRELGVAVAQAQGEWMTEDFVPFRAALEFSESQTEQGILVFEKDNPSGLPEYADSLYMPVKFDF